MPEFHLDTSGRVDHVHPGNGRTYQVDWPELDAFTQGYIEALFFTNASYSYDELYEKGFSDLAPETLAAIIDDCAKFQAANAGVLADAYARDYGEDQAGRDFWYTRNRHGVGFWDRDELKPEGAAWDSVQIPLDQWTDETRRLRETLKAASPGQLLTDACKAFRSLDAYLGDDGKVYLA